MMVYFSDEYGDLVAFSSDDELMMGLACMKSDTFHLFIKGTNMLSTHLKLTLVFMAVWVKHVQHVQGH